MALGYEAYPGYSRIMANQLQSEVETSVHLTNVLASTRRGENP